MPAREPSAATLARYSAEMGARGLRPGPRRAAAWRLSIPLDVDRLVELPWVAMRVMGASSRRMLDIASPKLLACWPADRFGIDEVVADLWADELSSWRRLGRFLGPGLLVFGARAMQDAGSVDEPAAKNVLRLRR